MAAVVVTFTAVAIQYAVVWKAEIASPGILYPSVFLIAWYFGFRAAVMSIILSIFCIDFFFFEPRFTFKIINYNDIVRLILYVFTSLVAAYIVARGRHADTEQKRVKLELTDIEERFQRSSAATNLGIWYCDLPFDELIWNKEVKDHFWLPDNARVTIETFYERIHPNDREPTRLAIQHSIENNAPYDIIYRTTNPKNTNQVKFIRAMGWTEYNAQMQPIRFDGITLDNTEMFMLSRERDESLEVLETLNRVGMTISREMDPKKLVQTVTDAATQLSRAEFGAFFYNVENDKGESYMLYTISGVSRSEFEKFPMPRNTEVFAPTFAGTDIIRSDDITKDPRYGKNSPYKGMPAGHLPVVSYLAVPVVSRTGKVIGGLFLGHKKAGVFTEREEKLVTGLSAQAAIAMDNANLLEQANKAIQLRDEFLSISSHELRTPLTPLKLQLQTLARHLERGTFDKLGEEQLKKIVMTSDKQVNRLTVLVDDLLDVSRITSGKLTLNFESIDLTQVIKEIIDRYLPQIHAAKSELELKLLDSLVVRADKLRIEQIIVNLITNAIKYAPATTLTVKLFEEGPYAVVSVSDQGPGISEIDQKRIFDRFERLTSETSQTGLGLGLYIVNQIVNAHGGTIKVESARGAGSTFMIRLPINH